MKTKKQLEPGVKYRGYGVLNSYGEFEFIPEETGKYKGRTKIIKHSANYKVSETRELIIMHITLPKSLVKTRIKLLNVFLETVNDVIKILREYEF